jgi:hypothetical protein
MNKANYNNMVRASSLTSMKEMKKNSRPLINVPQIICGDIPYVESIFETDLPTKNKNIKKTFT